MKIAYGSDLHFEYHSDEPDWLPPLPESCDVMILAGDIGTRGGAIDAVKRIAAALPVAHIIFVAGNHEYYLASIDNQLAIYRLAFEKEERIHFLENDPVQINGIRFLGCTLWSGFDLLGKAYVRPSMEQANRYITDFQLIKDKSGSQRFSAMHAIRRYRESRHWLIGKLRESDPDKTVVITHFPPCREARHKKIPEDILSCYFQANCESLIKKYQPRAWVYGHNHWSMEIAIGKTLLCSNQLGYPDEKGSIPSYDPTKVLEI